MSYRNCGLCLAVLSVTGFGLIALPMSAHAQGDRPANADTTSNDQLNKPINLDVRSANLYYALTLLFEQLKVGNYTLPDGLKQIEVSAKFTNLPLRTALETLLKNSGYTYKVDLGVYSVVPKLEEKQPEPLPIQPTNTEPVVKGKKVYRLSGNEIVYNAVDIVTRLGGRVLPGPTTGGVGSGLNTSGGLGNGFGGLGNGLSGGIGGFGGNMGGGYGGLGGGLGGFGNGFGGYSGGGGIVGGGGYYGGGNNYGGGIRR